jgi:hypothetical protein
VIRAFFIALFSAIVVGACTACLVLLANDVPSGDTLAIVLLSPLMFTLPGGILGGIAALLVARSVSRPRQLWGWVRVGLGFGAILGACEMAVLGLGFGMAGHPRDKLALILAVGTIAGAASGAITGVGCHRALDT